MTEPVISVYRDGASHRIGLLPIFISPWLGRFCFVTGHCMRAMYKNRPTNSRSIAVRWQPGVQERTFVVLLIWISDFACALYS